jgi:hypothetical protein
MGHSLGDGLIVAALAAAFVAWLYFRHVERRRRLEIVAGASAYGRRLAVD